MRLEESGWRPLYDYTLAGGDVALFASREAPEDDPEAGIKMLKEVAEGKKKVLYVRISCGLSAPFVAGQLEYCMDHPDIFTPLLIGFNPAHLARNNPIEKWDKTFLQVATRLLEECHTDRWPILNPIIGPEPITGSSRMKSGSATKILLETIFTMAHQMALTPKNFSLTSGGRIVYLGSGGQGVVGVIDASECPPTYGCGFDDVRGFLDKGYNDFRNKEGDISHEVQLSTEYFKKDVLPTLKEKDLVVFLRKGGDPIPDSDVMKSSATIVFVQLFNGEDQVAYNPGQSVIVELPRHDLLNIIGIKTLKDCQQFLMEIATKWVCNALTTGAHILKGKVYQNFMVDVKVSNNKLYYRAIGIIQRFCECTKEEAEDSLLRSIYQTDDVPERIRQATVSTHILQGSTMEKVVPIAMVMTLRRCNYQSAVSTFEEFPVVGSALAQYMQPRSR